MRKLQILLLFLGLLTTFSGEAQKLAVRDFEARPQDMDAHSNTFEKLDRNGKRAAIIKIFTDLPNSELTFDGSGLGFVAQEQHGAGQVWLYVPRASQKVTISHPKYDPLTFYYPNEIKEGRVYFMRLSPEGKEVSLVASSRNVAIWIDGDSVGVSPVNTYIPFGTHAVRAKLGSLHFDGNIVVDREGPSQFTLKMEDENLKYGDVSVTVPEKAEIWFQGRRVGLGEWHDRLKSGTYSVELRKPNCETTVEQFMVEAGKRCDVKAKAPIPYRGYLTVEINPSTGAKIYDVDGDTVVAEHRLAALLPVGEYSYVFRKKGYVPQTRTFSVKRNEDTADTVMLRRIQYIRPNSVYIGAGINYGNVLGADIHAGVTYSNINLEAGYILGFTKSDELYWFENTTDFFDSKCKYTTDAFYLKAGYQFSFVQRIGLTPQVGYMGQRLRGGSRGNGAMCHNISIGAKVIFNPHPAIGVFVTPEYAVPVSVNALYDDIASRSNVGKGGFYVSAGVSFNFKL